MPRRATAADAPAIRDLVRAAYAKWVAVIGREPKPMGADYDRAIREHMVFVIDGPGRLDAAVELIPAADHVLVENVAVHPAAQGRGLGVELMAMAERVARYRRVAEMRLYTNGRFFENITLYERLGYVVSRREALPGGGDVVWMRKRLDEPVARAAPTPPPQSSKVPLWRDGTAPLGRTVFHRGVRAALAMTLAVGTLSRLVLGGAEATLGALAVPTALCVAASLFALWQLWLCIVAAGRTRRWGGDARAVHMTVIAACVGACAIGLLLYDRAIPQLREMWAIYHGDQDLGAFETVVSNGHTLLLSGPIGVNAPGRVRQLLDAHPGVKAVVLEGPGGRMGAAYEIFTMIRARGLDTRVEGECHSACTVAFLAGAQRSLGPFGMLGFHSAGFPGMSSADMASANLQLERFMVELAGVDRAFAQRVVRTPHDQIWSPTPDELLAAGVIHRSDAGRP